jgi:DNA-binding transcriptional ArsR family regulator
MSDVMFVGQPTAPRVRFATSPAYNALCSLCLLSQDHLDNISSWVDATKQHLSDDERKQAKLACHVAPFVPPEDTADIEQLLRAFSRLDPARIVKIDADRTRRKALYYLPATEVPSLEQIENDRQIYLDLVARMCATKDHECDPGEVAAQYDEMRKGPGYRDRIVQGVRHLWEKYLKEEWPHVQPVIDTSVAAFESIDVPGESFVDQLKFITERDVMPDEWITALESAKEVVFIPSVHIGPFMILFDFDGHTAYIMGHARVPEGSTVQAVELDRSDLLIRLAALSDASRLRVLELAAERGSITTQDVMDVLDLSQSSASRHLTQLTATGLLSVDASERTKRYRANGARVDQVFAGLKDLLGAKVQG